MKTMLHVDDHNIVKDKLRILDETPDDMRLPAKFYPQREFIYGVFAEALKVDKAQYLKVDRSDLRHYADKMVAHWLHEDLRDNDYLNG